MNLKLTVSNKSCNVDAKLNGDGSEVAEVDFEGGECEMINGIVPL